MAAAQSAAGEAVPHMVMMPAGGPPVAALPMVSFGLQQAACNSKRQGLMVLPAAGSPTMLPSNHRLQPEANNITSN
jgi:hypothetical protein